MPEKFQEDIVSLKESGGKNNLEKYEAVLRELLEKYKKAKKNGPQPKWARAINFDISNPHREDMKKFWSGDFEITNFKTLEKNGKIMGFNFYIGDTEFIIRGEAADRVLALLENNLIK